MNSEQKRIYCFFLPGPPGVCTDIADICLVIDSSGSINDPPGQSVNNWDLVKEFASTLVDFFTIGPDQTRFGAVIFSSGAFLEFPLNRHTNSADLKRAIRNLRYLARETNTPEAFKIARTQCFTAENGDRPDVRNVIIFISDGLPHPRDRREPAIAEARVLKAFNTRIIAVGVTDSIDLGFLQEISSLPRIENQDYFRTPSFEALSMISQTVAEVGCIIPTPGLSKQ